jgi:hypothetical protein
VEHLCESIKRYLQKGGLLVLSNFGLVPYSDVHCITSQNCVYFVSEILKLASKVQVKFVNEAPETRGPNGQVYGDNVRNQ